MSLTYRAIRAAWRTLVPSSLNEFAFNANSPISRAILAGKTKLETVATHDELYDRIYYSKYSDAIGRSAIGIVETTMQHLSPSSVIDIGCGSGEVIRQFASVGVTVMGLDYSDAALTICREQGLYVEKCDLKGDLAKFKNLRADLAISTEVAEHLAASCADRYVDLLCTIARRNVVLTAAPPGQGGTNHVNEQPHSYWIEKFERRGAHFSEEQTSTFRREWTSSGVDWCHANNVMVFHAKTLNPSG